jgi:hypothetical protein
MPDDLRSRHHQDGFSHRETDRRRDRCRRRVDRRLRALAADGVTIVRALFSERMHLDAAIIEVIEYADRRGFVIRICATAEPSRLLDALDLAEDPSRRAHPARPLGRPPRRTWRGPAIVDAPL